MEGEIKATDQESLREASWDQSLIQPEPEKTIRFDLGGNVKIELMLIPSGSFMMGDEKGDPEEKPVHKVRLRNAR